MKMLYKYPQVEFPYAQLVEENQRRGREAPEFELVDALRDVFEAGPLLRRLRRVRQGRPGGHPVPHHGRQSRAGAGAHPRAAPSVVPQHLVVGLWPAASRAARHRPRTRFYTEHRHLGERWWYVDAERHLAEQGASLLFTENETNSERLFGSPNATPYVKDGINDAVVHGLVGSGEPEQDGTKVAAHFQAIVAPGEAFTVRVRFSDAPHDDPFGDFDAVFQQRIAKPTSSTPPSSVRT